MANLSNPKDNIAKNEFSVLTPQDRDFATLRTRSRAVRDGRDRYTLEELNRIIAQLLLER